MTLNLTLWAGPEHKCVDVFFTYKQKAAPYNINQLVSQDPVSPLYNGNGRFASGETTQTKFLLSASQRDELLKAKINFEVGTLDDRPVLKILKSPDSQELWVQRANQITDTKSLSIYIDPHLSNTLFDAFYYAPFDGVPYLLLKTGMKSSRYLLMVEHEAIHHSTHYYDILYNNTSDNSLGISFKKEMPILQIQTATGIKGVNLPGGYMKEFSVDEIKAYSDQAIRARSLPDEYPLHAKENVHAFAESIPPLLEGVEHFISSLPANKEQLLVGKPLFKNSTGVYVFEIKIPDPSFAGELPPLVVNIPLRDPAQNASTISNIREKLLNVVRTAKERVAYYSNLKMD